MVSSRVARHFAGGFLLFLGLVALSAGLLAVAQSPEAHAGSLTVTNTDDDGPGSLRQAIAAAAPGDTIEFALTYPATITLTTGELLIAKPLTITGPDPDLLAVSGNGASRVFRVDATGGAKQINVTISGLSLRDGLASAGGGIWNDENLALTDVILRGNWACETRGSGCNGGGLYNTGSDPRLTDVAFIGNWAGSGGGGMFNTGRSNPVLTRVLFQDNEAAAGGGGLFNYDYSNAALSEVTFRGNTTESLGGGIYNTSNSSPTLTDAVFSGNSARFYGGGMYSSYGSSPIVNRATFSGNRADIHGGGMGNSDDSSPWLTNVVIHGNAARSHGGGIYNYKNSSPVLTNVTLSGNAAGGLGGGIYNNVEANPQINNSILWGNLATTAGDQIYNTASTPAIAFSDVQGSGGSGAGWDGGLGTDGGGSIDADPQFVAPLDPTAAPTSDGDLHVVRGSPATDVGDNDRVPDRIETDRDGKARIVNDVVDLGAYEIQFRLLVPFLGRNLGP